MNRRHARLPIATAGAPAIAGLVAVVSLCAAGLVTGPTAAFASSSASSSSVPPVLAASSPATTLATTPPSVAPATTVPGTHTGEPWASRGYVVILVGAVLLGAVLLQPLLRRRSRTTT